MGDVKRAESAWSSTRWKRHFLIIWTGQAFSIAGSELVQFALVWWLTQTTGSGVVLATASLASMLPRVLLGPLAGALVDRWNRRTVMLTADSLTALLTAALVVLFALGRAQVWHVYLVMLLRAAAGAFHFPALQASTPLMVPKEHLTRVAGMNQTLYGVIGVLAPPTGALLISALPTPAVLSLDILTALVAVVPLALIPIPQPPRLTVRDARSPVASVLRDTGDGLRYVRSRTGIFIILLMGAGINFLANPASALLPILVTQHLGGRALQLAWMDSAAGIGTIAGGLCLSVWGGFKRRVFTYLLGLTGMGVGILLVGAAPAGALPLALGGMLLSGFMTPITNGPVWAVLQASVPPGMQGRVTSLVISISSAVVPLSLMVAGPLADLAGVRTWYWLAGSACVGMAVAALFIPAVMSLEGSGPERSKEQRPTAIP